MIGLRLMADGLSVVWREGGVCQTLAGRVTDRALAGEYGRSCWQVRSGLI
jgi:hypothetical protein